MLPAVMVLAAMPAAALAQTGVGDWIGTLTVSPTMALRVAVHIQAGADGKLAGTFDSLDQNANGTPIDAVTMADATLTFAVPDNGGRYTGKWNAATASWDGHWSQGGPSLPLTLKAGGPPPLPPTPVVDWVLPTDAAIAAILDQRIAQRPGEGIVVGIIDRSGRRTIARGPVGATPFDGRTLFEIGSMTKVFTGLLLADMARRGEVRLDDPAAKYLPKGATMPARGRAITLLDLTTHRSGLPRLPTNLPMGDRDDPYADFTEAMLLDFLKGYTLPRDVGSQYEYSNLGAGLLGYLLGRAAGTDYETLVRTRITGPLGMTDTAVMPTAAGRRRAAIPHDGYMRPSKPWSLSVLKAAGDLRSDSDDMLTFLGAQLGLTPIAPGLASAMAAARTPQADGPGPLTRMGMGWMIARTRQGPIVTHGGATGGFTTTMAIDSARRRGVVVLTNSAVQPGADDIGMHVLTGAPVEATPPPPAAPVERVAVTIAPAELDRFVGRYRLQPDVEIAIVRDGDHLAAQLTGQASYPLFASGPLDFFWRIVDAQLRFEMADGRAVAATLVQDGKTTRAARIDTAP